MIDAIENPGVELGQMGGETSPTLQKLSSTLTVLQSSPFLVMASIEREQRNRNGEGL